MLKGRIFSDLIVKKKKEKTMRPELRYPILKSLLSPLHGHQKKSMALVIAALVECGTARTMAMADKLVEWTGARFHSALERIYRLLKNDRIDELSLTRQLLKLMGSARNREVLVGVDWTEWHSGLRMLIASAVVGRRAIPLQAHAYTKSKIRRSQNIWENTFARMLARASKEAMVRIVLLCDRGFRRVSWLKLLIDLELDFVVRLKDDVHVHLPRLPDPVALSNLGLKRGKTMDLGWVPIRQDAAVQVRVIGVWAPRAKSPWWLATSFRRRGVKKITAYYDRRMTIEEQIRDTKGKRFGTKLYWTQFKNPRALSRFMLLLGFASLLWHCAGFLAAKQDNSRLLIHPTKGPRQSYITIGQRNLRLFAVYPPTRKLVRSSLIPPALRLFDWIDSSHPPPKLSILRVQREKK